MDRQYQNNFENYLTVQRMSGKTKKSYLQAVRDLEAYQKQSADTLRNYQIQDYLIYNIQEKELAGEMVFLRSRQNFSDVRGCGPKDILQYS